MRYGRFLAGLGLAVTMASGAAAADNLQHVAFGYNPAELQTSEGVSQVHARLERAARRQCVTERARGQLPAHAFGACKRDVEMKLAQQIDHPALLALVGEHQSLASRD